MKTVIRCVYDGAAIRPVNAAEIKAFKDTLKSDVVVAMTLEPWGEARSRAQQGLVHELFSRYARAMGESMGDVKVRCKFDLGYWLPAAKILDGTIDLPKHLGAWIDLHAVYPAIHAPRTIAFIRSESTYTKKMEGALVDRIMEMCDANGVGIGDIVAQLRGGENG